MVILDFLLEILYIDGIALGYFNVWAVTSPIHYILNQHTQMAMINGCVILSKEDAQEWDFE